MLTVFTGTDEHLFSGMVWFFYIVKLMDFFEAMKNLVPIFLNVKNAFL